MADVLRLRPAPPRPARAFEDPRWAERHAAEPEGSVPSCGNVFADLGFANPFEEQRKADLVIDIADAIGRRGLSQTVAARLMGLSEPDASDLLRGRTGGYSVERLLTLVEAIAHDCGCADGTVCRQNRACPRLSVQ